VFRHPDHAPANYDLRNDFKKLSINNFDLAKASSGALKNLFGSVGDVVLFWAHHEKLLVVDERLAFMGGLDMCKRETLLAALCDLGLTGQRFRTL
jgi:phospholipase D1/2